ncbi:MAG: tetratricopeptide repeat-containing sensor histidine kinase, partial [Ignavibacteriales bacterium]|nr:tetratricopeptide repeat-containing sensor histidine kinase [Ignavibacteriales bacterium]
AFDINKQVGDIQGLGYSANNVGLALYRLGDKKRALQSLEQALQYRIDVDSKEGISNSYVNLAMYYLGEGDLQKALMYGQKNLDFVRTSGFLFLLADAYDVLAQVHMQRKEFEQAYRDHVRFTELKDSINNAQQQKTLSELQVMYETERKETENALLRENQAKQEAVIRQQTILTASSVILFILMTVAVVALFRTIKVQKKANALLKQQNEIIEKQRAQLEETNEVKDKLFSVLTHDLRGPVTSLKTFIAHVDDPILSEKEMHEYFQFTASTIDNIMALIENVLHWSKSQWKGIVSEPTKINLHYIVKDRIRLLEPHAHQKSISVQNFVAPSAQAFADYQMIDIVMRNLLSNAIKFTGHDGVVRIRTVDHDDFVEVSVEDTGIGMSKEHVERIFISEGISTPGTANERGTGLGLILCKEFVEKSGGALWVESEIGKGTIVTFSLPRSSRVQKQETILAQ